MRKGLIIATCVLAPVVALSGLVGLWMLQRQSSHQSNTVPPSEVVNEKTDPYLKSPIPDPNSDVLFGFNSRDLSIIRYSPTKGFWGAERGYFRAIGNGLHVDGHYMFATYWGPFPSEIVAVDLLSPRPWAASSVIQIGGILRATAFDATRHRYFVLSDNNLHAFEERAGTSFKLINKIAINVNAGSIVVDGNGRFLFSCPGPRSDTCLEFDIDPETGALSPAEGREINVPGFRYTLRGTQDGRFLLVPDMKPGVHEPPEYRLNQQLKYVPVPGTGKEIPDEGYMRVYRIQDDGTVVEVSSSPFRMEHAVASTTLSPNGRFLYAGWELHNPFVGGVDVYSFDSESGTLTYVPDAIFAPGRGGEDPPLNIFFGQSPERAFADTKNDQIIAWDADPETGRLTRRATSSLWPHLGFVLSATKTDSQNH